MIQKWLAANADLYRNGVLYTGLLDGFTQPLAEQLRELGCIWSGTRKGWLIPYASEAAVIALKNSTRNAEGLLYAVSLRSTTKCVTPEHVAEMTAMLKEATTNA